MRTPILFALSADRALPGRAPAPSRAPVAAVHRDGAHTTIVAVTARGAADIVETRTVGADCVAAAAISARRATAAPSRAWARARSGLDDDGPDAGAASAGVDAVLTPWRATLVPTAASPDGPERNMFKHSQGAFMRTPLARDRHLDIRARSYPMLCRATGVETGQCDDHCPDRRAALEVLQTGT
jgi:hypothetical protein